MRLNLNYRPWLFIKVCIYTGQGRIALTTSEDKVDKRVIKGLLVALLISLSAITATSISHADDGYIDARASHFRDGRSKERGPTPKLYDARGDVVGDVVLGSNDSDNGGVVLNINGVLVYASFSRISLDGGFTRSATQMVWDDREPVFGGPDCTGAQYIAAPNSVLRPAAMIRQGAKVTLLIGVEGRAEDRVIVSDLESGQCIGNYSFLNSVWRVENTLDLTAKYPEPLRVGF